MYQVFRDRGNETYGLQTLRGPVHVQALKHCLDFTTSTADLKNFESNLGYGVGFSRIFPLTHLITLLYSLVEIRLFAKLAVWGFSSHTHSLTLQLYDNVPGLGYRLMKKN